MCVSECIITVKEKEAMDVTQYKGRMGGTGERKEKR